MDWKVGPKKRKDKKINVCLVLSNATSFYTSIHFLTSPYLCENIFLSLSKKIHYELHNLEIIPAFSKDLWIEFFSNSKKLVDYVNRNAFKKKKKTYGFFQFEKSYQNHKLTFELHNL